MTDLSLTIAPKSDQLNSDDLIAGPRTIKVTRVAGRDNAEQPIAISFEGDNGKPYMPCKSMRRVLVQVWGKDGTKYPGRAMTIYRDPEVSFGGMKVGGIRISHMSDIQRDVTMALTATRANKKPFTVKPLADQPAGKSDALDAATRFTTSYLGKITAETTIDRLAGLEVAFADKLTELKAKRPELHQQIVDATAARRAEIEEAAVSEHQDAGEAFTGAEG